MGARLMAGFDRTTRIRLPEGETKLDPKDPIGAAATGAIIRVMNRANDMEDIGNMLTLKGSVSVADSSKQVVIGSRETFVYKDASDVEHETDDHDTCKMFERQGMSFVRVVKQDIMG